MFNFLSQREVQSAKYPGVTFTVRAMTEAVRMRMMTRNAEALAEVRRVQSDLDAIEHDEGESYSAEQKLQIVNLLDQGELIKRTRIDPTYVEFGFVSLSGMTIDGVADVDWKTLHERGPEELYQEVVEAVKADSQMSREERANLESPTTSAAQAGGRTDDSIAANAGETDSTSTETAPDTIPQT